MAAATVPSLTTLGLGGPFGFGAGFAFTARTGLAFCTKTGFGIEKRGFISSGRTGGRASNGTTGVWREKIQK